MAEDSVWVKAVCNKDAAVGDNWEELGGASEASPLPCNEDNLCRTAKDIWGDKIKEHHLRLIVFALGADHKNVSYKMDPGDPISMETSSSRRSGPGPLIVVAPAHEEQQSHSLSLSLNELLNVSDDKRKNRRHLFCANHR